MSETSNLLAEESPLPEPDPETATEPAPDDRPAGLPDKFWDAEVGAVRTEALAKSYTELEKRLGDGLSAPAPETPEGYEIAPPEGYEDLLASDADVNARLHEAGFTNEQASLVYELAAERLIPMVEALAADMGHARETAELVRRFGGDDRWRETRSQIEAWGRAHLAPAAFEALGSTADGVMAMHRMMQSGEPAVLAGSGNAAPALTETELKRMMQDPRYWRDEDPAYVARVQAGFETLYPG